MTNKPNRTPSSLSSRLQRRLTGWERLEDRTTPSAGALDAGFGSGGLVAYNLIPADFVKVDSALQTNGKIVTVGRIPGSGGADVQDSAVTRRNADGTLDVGFGNGGVAVLNFANFEELRAVAVQPDGKIVVGGADEAGRFTFARFNSNGLLDNTFDGDGVALFGAGGEEVWDLVIQPDGKIVAGGYLDGDLGLIRINANGSLDTGFGVTGIVSIDSGPFNAFFSTVRLQADGKIVAAGHQVGNNNANNQLAIARFTADGRFDTTFGNGGLIRTVFRGSDFADHIEDLVIQPDGKLLFVGHSAVNSAGDADWAALRLLGNGARDPAFGSGGLVVSNYGERYAWARGVALESSGQILIVGEIATGNINTVNSLIVRLNANGSLDNAFGTQPALGRTIVNAGVSDGFNQVYVLASRILAVGYVRDAGTTLARFLNPPPTTVNEGAQATRTGSLSEFGGTVSSLSASIGNVTMNTGAGTWTWTFNATDGPDQTQTVTITAQLAGGGQSAVAFGLVVDNVAPTVSVTGPGNTSVNEGQQATASGTFADLGNDIVSITASIGTITKTGTQSGTWSWSFNTSDGPDQTQTVTITATDSDGAQATTAFGLNVNNVAPTVTISGNPTVNKLAPYTLNVGNYVDPGPESASYQVHWGDGTTTGPFPISFRAVQHAYQTPGNYVIRLDLFDEDGTYANAAQTQVQVLDAAPDLALTATANRARIRRGRPVTYTITIVNNGNSLATGVFATLRLRPSLTFLKTGSTPGWREAPPRTFRVKLGTLGVGQSVTVVFRASVAANARRGPLSLTISADSDGSQGPDDNPADNAVKVTFRVV